MRRERGEEGGGKWGEGRMEKGQEKEGREMIIKRKGMGG